jgi:hypothetical protein
MPIYRGLTRPRLHHNMGLATPTYQGPGSYNSGPNQIVPTPSIMTQQAPASSLTMGYQTPAQALQARIMAILTPAEVTSFTDMTKKVREALNDDELEIMQDSVQAMLGVSNLYKPVSPLTHPLQGFQDAIDAADIPPEGIQPGYNALDHELAVQLVAEWIERGSIVEDELNGTGPEGDVPGKRMFLNTVDTTEEAMAQGAPMRQITVKRLRPQIRIKPLYMDSANVNELIEGPAKQTGTSLLPSMPHVSALLAGCTMKKADGWVITDGLVECIVAVEDVDQYNNPTPDVGGVGYSLPGTTNIQQQIMGYSRGLKGPPADEITGTSYAEVQTKQAIKRLHDAQFEEYRKRMEVVTGTGKHSADLDAPEVRFTHPNGGTTSVAFKPRRVNPLTGVPNMPSEEVLAREAVKALGRIKSDVQKMAEESKTTIGVHLDPVDEDMGPEEMEPTLLVGTPAPAPGAAAAVPVPVPIQPLSAAALAYPNIPSGYATTHSGISSVPIASIPTSNTVASATYTGVFTTGSSNTTVGLGTYIQNPQWSGIGALTDEDGDEIPTVRMRNLRPGFQYKGVDGTIIEVDATGNFTIRDENAQITYLATRVRNFNRFVNGSDLVGEFIEDLGRLGATQEQAAAASIEMLIRWLVHKAAEHDQEAPPEDVPAVSAAELETVEIVPPGFDPLLPYVPGQEPTEVPPFIIDEAGVRLASYCA